MDKLHERTTSLTDLPEQVIQSDQRIKPFGVPKTIIFSTPTNEIFPDSLLFIFLNNKS